MLADFGVETGEEARRTRTVHRNYGMVREWPIDVCCVTTYLIARFMPDATRRPWPTHNCVVTVANTRSISISRYAQRGWLSCGHPSRASQPPVCSYEYEQVRTTLAFSKPEAASIGIPCHGQAMAHNNVILVDPAAPERGPLLVLSAALSAMAVRLQASCGSNLLFLTPDPVPSLLHQCPGR